MPAKTPRLYQSRHGVFYLRVQIPAPLHTAMGKRETWHSLRTKDPKEANVFALSYALELAKAKTGMSDKRKTIQDITGDISNPLKIYPDGAMEFDLTKPEERDMAMEIARSQQPKDNHPPVISAAQRQAWQQQDVEKMRSSAEAFVQLEAERDAILEQHRKPKGRLFAAVVEEYFKLNGANLAPRTAKKYRNANNTFLNWIGKGATLDEVTKDKWHNFKIYLATGDTSTGRAAISPKTIDQYTNGVSGVLKMVYGEHHPLRGQTLVKKRMRAAPVGKTFTPDEVTRIFSVARLNDSAHPSDLWGNLLGLFTGARLNEIFQLRLADVRPVNGLWVLDLQEDTPDNHLKTLASRRLVPLHQTLIDLGFLDYLQDVQNLPNASTLTLVFPFLTQYEQGWGDVPSQRFTNLLKDLKIHIPRVKVFHSFRHTVNQRLKFSGISTEYRSLYLGHEIEDVNTMVYGDQSPVQVVADKVLPVLGFEEVAWHEVKIKRQEVKAALEKLYRLQSTKQKHRQAKSRKEKTPA